MTDDDDDDDDDDGGPSSAAAAAAAAAATITANIDDKHNVVRPQQTPSDIGTSRRPPPPHLNRSCVCCLLIRKPKPNQIKTTNTVKKLTGLWSGVSMGNINGSTQWSNVRLIFNPTNGEIKGTGTASPQATATCVVLPVLRHDVRSNTKRQRRRLFSSFYCGW
jgi:hypothetical protein